MSRYIFIALLIFVFPLTVFAYDYDLAITNSDISFSESNFIVGDTIRIYATIHNVGDKDVRAYVSFFQLDKLIDDSQAISVRSNGSGDVWVDFVIPDNKFNILARIQGSDPSDQNNANNEALSPMITPDKDTDQDQIVDRLDEDDDNDGLTDLEENEIGSNPLLADTDGDGIDDGEDLYPLDPEKWEESRDIFAPSTNQGQTENSQSPTESVDNNINVLEQINTQYQEISQLDNENEQREISYNSTLKYPESNQIKSSSLDNLPQSKTSWYLTWWFWTLLSGIILVMFIVYYLFFSNKNTATKKRISYQPPANKKLNNNNNQALDLRNIKLKK